MISEIINEMNEKNMIFALKNAFNLHDFQSKKKSFKLKVQK